MENILTFVFAAVLTFAVIYFSLPTNPGDPDC